MDNNGYSVVEALSDIARDGTFYVGSIIVGAAIILMLSFYVATGEATEALERVVIRDQLQAAYSDAEFAREMIRYKEEKLERVLNAGFKYAILFTITALGCSAALAWGWANRKPQHNVLINTSAGVGRLELGDLDIDRNGDDWGALPEEQIQLLEGNIEQPKQLSAPHQQQPATTRNAASI